MSAKRKDTDPSSGADMYKLCPTPGLRRQSAQGTVKSTVEARVSTAEVLETFREAFTIEIAQSYCRADRAGYSMASGYCGASISVLTGIRAMFKPIFGADIDKICRAMYIDITGAPCYCAVDDIP